jgi:hypothetical protein
MQEDERQVDEERGALRGKRGGRGRTAELPSPPTAAVATAVLQHDFGANVVPTHPCGCEIRGVDIAAMDGNLPPKMAGAVEVRGLHSSTFQLNLSAWYGIGGARRAV